MKKLIRKIRAWFRRLREDDDVIAVVPLSNPFPAAEPAPAPVTHPAWTEPEETVRATKQNAPLQGESFAFGRLDSPLIYGTDDNAKYAQNFDYLMGVAGKEAAFDYLIKHVPGGPALYRSTWQARGGNSDESARVVNRYGQGTSRGRVEGEEYVFAAPFTAGKRYKLPNP